MTPAMSGQEELGSKSHQFTLRSSPKSNDVAGNKTSGHLFQKTQTRMIAFSLFILGSSQEGKRVPGPCHLLIWE